MSTTDSATIQTTSRLPRAFTRRGWKAVAAAYGTAALLSALQIHLRQSLSGGSVPLLQQLSLNLLAWLPWAVFAGLVMGHSRNRRTPARRWPKELLAQALLAHWVVGLFLTYLALFRFAFFPAVTGAFSSQSLLRQVGAEAGEFYLASLALYGIVWGVARTLRSRAPADLDSVREAGVAPLAEAEVEPVEHLPEVDTLVIRSVGRTDVVRFKEIDWIEADGAYARIHCGARCLLMRRSIKGLQQQLSSAGFARIHRSRIVNLKRVTRVRALARGDAIVILSSGPELRASRSYRALLAAAIESRA